MVVCIAMRSDEKMTRLKPIRSQSKDGLREIDWVAVRVVHCLHDSVRPLCKAQLYKHHATACTRAPSPTSMVIESSV